MNVNGLVIFGRARNCKIAITYIQLTIACLLAIDIKIIPIITIAIKLPINRELSAVLQNQVRIGSQRNITRDGYIA